MAKPLSTRLSTLVVMISTFTSRLLGFARTMVVTHFFGATGVADVLNAVFMIPNTLRKLLAEGALSSAFIPVLSKTHQADPTGHRSRELVRSILTFQLVIILPVIGFSIVFAPQIISVLTNFSDPALTSLSVELFRWFIFYLLFISISAVFIGVQNSHQHFVISAVTPLLFSFFVIASLPLFFPAYGVHAQTIGIIAGGIAQVLFQVPSMLKLRYSLKPKIRFLTRDFKEVLKKYAPTLSTSLIFLFSQLVSMRLATTLSVGSASCYSYALIFWQLPQGIFAASISTVLFPLMTRQVIDRDGPGLSNSLSQGLQGLLFFLLPSAVLIQMMGFDIIHLVLYRGLFTLENTALTADVLIYLSWGLFGVGAFNFLLRLFYSFHDFKTPFYVSLGAVALDLTLSISLMGTPLGVRSLALGNSSAYTLGFLVLLFLARHKLPQFPVKSLFVFLGKLILAMILPILFLGGVDFFWPLPMDIPAEGLHLLRFGTKVLGAGVLFLGGALGLKIDFLRFLRRKKSHGTSEK